MTAFSVATSTARAQQCTAGTGSGAANDRVTLRGTFGTGAPEHQVEVSLGGLTDNDLLTVVQSAAADRFQADVGVGLGLDTFAAGAGDDFLLERWLPPTLDGPAEES